MLAILLLLGCGAQSNLTEDITAPIVVPNGSDYDNRLAVDAGNSGVAIRPGVDWVLGATILRIENRTGEAIVCDVWEDGLCPHDDLEIGALEAGEIWEQRFTCFLGDVACFASDAEPSDLPIRGWTWFVEPDADAAAE